MSLDRFGATAPDLRAARLLGRIGVSKGNAVRVRYDSGGSESIALQLPDHYPVLSHRA